MIEYEAIERKIIWNEIGWISRPSFSARVLIQLTKGNAVNDCSIISHLFFSFFLFFSFLMILLQRYVWDNARGILYVNLQKLR